MSQMRHRSSSTTRSSALEAGNARKPPGVAKGHFRMGPLLTIPRVLRDLGFDPAEILAACGIACDLFDDPENTVPIASASRLLALCAARTGVPHFALLVARGAPAASLGTVAYLVLSSPNVGAALAHLVTHLNLQDRGGVAALRREGARAVLTYALVDAHVEGTDHAHTLAMAVGQNVLRSLCGPHWRPAAVTLPCARPRDVAPYRAYFGIAPAFDAPEASLVFPLRELETPLAGADASLNRLMRDRADSATRIAENDLAHEVRRRVHAQVTHGWSRPY